MLIMHFLWNLYLLLLFCLPLPLCAKALTGENDKEPQQLETETVGLHLKQPANPMFGRENTDFVGPALSWPMSSSEESDRQGVIGEYTDLHESTDTSLLYSKEEGLIISRPTDSAAEDDTFNESAQPLWLSSAGEPPQPTQGQTFKYQPAETSTTSVLHSTQTGDNQPNLSASQNETTDSYLPFLLSVSHPSNRLDQDSNSSLIAGPWPIPKQSAPPVATSRWEWTTGPLVTTQGEKQDVLVKEIEDEAVTMESEKDGSRSNDVHALKTSGTLLLDGNMDTSATPCKTTNPSWTPTYQDDFPPNESLHASLTHALFVPLYSDWNSALATWGLAWEAHIYGLGSVFSVFGLISVVCLLGLPLRCPPGSPYLTLLHFFLLAFAGTQAFCLLYDAYNYQDRLPPLESLLLSELPFPCLISAFSLAFLLLSLRLRMCVSLTVPISTSFSSLPKPGFLLFISLLHFGVSLGCVGLLQLFQSLPTMILLFPQGLFVCLSIFLSFSYLVFYCLIKVDTKHIYRLNESGESGGSPELTRPESSPFAKVEDWDRAAGAGVGVALCLLGCGGLQLYGILHYLGLGGVDGYGFLPWPWWGYQVGCRLCETGVCLGLSLIGTHPLFCYKNSPMKTHPRPGSWSRLSCSSPSRGFTLPSQEGAVSPVLSSHDSWSQHKQENLVVCDVITKCKSEVLPLCSMLDPPANRPVCAPKSSQTRANILPLPTPPSPPHKPRNAVESQLSSQDSLGTETDSTVDLRPPSPINLSRSIDQALFNESLFSHSIFGLPRLFQTSSSLSLSSLNKDTTKPGFISVENALYRTSSCGDVNQETTVSTSTPSQPYSSLPSNNKSKEHWDWKGSVSGSTQGLCSNPKDTGKLSSHSWANRGQNFAQSSLPRAIPHLSYHRHYRTLSLASQDSQGSGRLAGTKQLSESKQLELDLAVQAEFVNVCRQIDALSVCSDTIEL
ncbi:proline-rich transmembrane protein 4 isoform X1 [Channa argus]|uniref:proline-rich transmembrane protein 4 isoform X1 n=2 Tax=Channa argus TaxID=215402 RepID=UPI0035211209